MSTSPRSLLQNFLSLFLQSACPLCERPTPQDFCPTCTRQLEDSRLKNPAEFWRGQPAVFSWGAYRGRVKRTIAHLKYDQQPQIARPLGQWLAEAWLSTEISHSKFTVVPIPLHPDKQQQRGYNQADLIAQSFCEFTSYPLRHGLERVRSTEALFGLSPTQREASLSQAFGLGKSFQRHHPSQPVLLVDDIYTTGATVRAAIQTLHRHGIRVCGVAVVAKAEMINEGARSGVAAPQRNQTPDSDQAQ